MYPHVPRVLQRFAQEYPRVKVHAALRLTRSSCKAPVRPRRDRPDPDHRGGARPRRRDAGARAAGLGRGAGRPGLAVAAAALRLHARAACSAGRRSRRWSGQACPWELAVDSVSCSAVEVSVAADLAVSVQLAELGAGRAARRSATAGRCRSCPSTCINMYVGDGAAGGARRAAGRAACARPTARGLPGASRRSRLAPDTATTTLPVAARLAEELEARRSASSSGSTWLDVRPAAGRCRCQAKSVSRLPRAAAGCSARPGAEVEADQPSGSSPAAGWPGSAAPRRRRSRCGSSARPGPRRRAGRRRRARRPRCRRRRRRRRAPSPPRRRRRSASRVVARARPRRRPRASPRRGRRASTRAPISAPSSTAVSPTPPAAPVTSSVSPGRSRASSASATWLVP